MVVAKRKLIHVEITVLPIFIFIFVILIKSIGHLYTDVFINRGMKDYRLAKYIALGGRKYMKYMDVMLNVEVNLSSQN